MSEHTTRRPLNEGWTLCEVPREGASPSTILPPVPASVPGNVHLDLVRAGIIAHPFHRLMERAAEWVDYSDWNYETTFSLDFLPSCPILIFHGLDTIADIRLNGHPLGRTDNMFVAHEFPVLGLLNPGENTLSIRFSSAIREGQVRRVQWEAEGQPSMPAQWFVWGDRSFVRKAQYMYGWDWGPEPVSAGIWGPVELLEVPVARFLDWRYTCDLSQEHAAEVTLEVFVRRSPGSEETPLRLDIALVSPEGEPLPVVSVPVPSGAGRVRVPASIVLDHPRLWYPNGQRPTAAALYTVEMCLVTSAVIETLRGRIGLRTVELIREPEPDGNGEGFLFRVNGEDLFIKGANWIPADSFPGSLPNASRAAQDFTPPVDTRVREQLLAAREAGCNMLRIWGGGLYESDHFYETCDELGLLVWQDFPYACAYYPDTGQYAEAACEEAVRAVRRLRIHPSLAIWCGNNENDMMFHLKWNDVHPPRYLGENLYRTILPAVVAEEDPERPYWPSSPYGGDDPNSPDYGDRHNWDVWHGSGDWSHYHQDTSRFASEFGFAASCGMAAWNTCLAEEDKSPRSAAVQWHDKTRKGYETYMGYVRTNFPDPDTLEDLVYFSQVNQAEALKCAVEHYRRLKGRCWGTLFWQWNDCWPVQSWAVIDYLLEKKAAYYAACRFHAPVLLSLAREDGRWVRAHLTNDRMEPIRGKVTLRLEDFEGRLLAVDQIDAHVDANGTEIIGDLDLGHARGIESRVFVHAAFEPDSDTLMPVARNTLFLAKPIDLVLPDPGFSLSVTQGAAPHLFEATVSARGFAPWVWLRDTEVGRKPADWSDNYFHLRAGEERTVHLTMPADVSLDEVRRRIAVRSLQSP